MAEAGDELETGGEESNMVKVVENQEVKGITRKLKRGRGRPRSSRKDGAESVLLEGGTIPTDSEIRACNRLFLRKEEGNAEEIWNIGSSLGFF